MQSLNSTIAKSYYRAMSSSAFKIYNMKQLEEDTIAAKTMTPHRREQSRGRGLSTPHTLKPKIDWRMHAVILLETEVYMMASFYVE